MKNEQYFDETPTSKDDETTFKCELAGINYQFYSNNGVFSKKYVDFGTRTLIDTVDKLNLAPNSVLDLGTGYGPIALFAATNYPQAEVTASEVNERAIGLAKKNFSTNGQDRINLVKSDLFTEITDNFDLILTNPPIRAGKSVINQLIEDSFKHLQPSGQLILVVQRKQGEPTIKEKMAEVFGNCEILKRNKGYYILRSQHAG
ncbi:class I SAM-dependent methyltransferase [Xylocopilactobacillus apicola]|uniref:16S RNA G1207 methylase RsmC n=1 Tax=Xylocopilactobacillus apicola TaxID=2932184 RepID=A0AAU9DGD2_9LACO|nr:methyltransferase [Xylocopilactobacillus apicola]BDR59010.1 16S RNA G1207 methylase RsmC [Xylocopilactobacillus apicola]